MLKRLKLFLVPESFEKTPENVHHVVSQPNVMDKVSTDNRGAQNNEGDFSATKYTTSASNSAFTASPSHLVTLPQAASHLSITFRLFGSHGKLLTHFEDDLELNPPLGSTHCSVIRDPIGFHIPELIKATKLPERSIDWQLKQGCNLKLTKWTQRCHINNSYFSPPHHQGSQDHSRSAVLASQERNSPPTTSSLTLSPLETDWASARCDNHLRYYGPISVLFRDLTAATPAAFKATPRRPANTARRDHIVAAIPVSLLLHQVDSLSGRTHPIGCLPSVPVARSRLVTHEFRESDRLMLAHQTSPARVRQL